jgi:hypothetical protein
MRFAKTTINESHLDVYESEDNLKAIISRMDSDDIALNDYIDSETGEIMLAAGDKARTSRLHPQNKLDYIKAREERFSQFDDDDDSESEYVEAQKALDVAVKEFASNWTDIETQEMSSTPEEIAPDVSDNFFYDYPEWKQWARVLHMTRDDIKSYVQDIVYEAMVNGSV